jgi:hypothetical protein
MAKKFPNKYQCGPIKNPHTGKFDVMLIVEGEGTFEWADGECHALLRILNGNRGEYGKLTEVSGAKVQ